MNFKKWICVILALALCAAVFAACAKTPAGEPEQTTAAEDATAEAADDDATAADDVVEIPEADRTTANLAGTYGFESYTIVAEAVDDTTLKFSVRWVHSDAQVNEWEMSGTFDPDTMRVNYSDCVCKTIFYLEDGTVTEQVEYENGLGRMQFIDLHSLIWNDEQGNVGMGITFTETAPEA